MIVYCEVKSLLINNIKVLSYEKGDIFTSYWANWLGDFCCVQQGCPEAVKVGIRDAALNDSTENDTTYHGIIVNTDWDGETHINFLYPAVRQERTGI